jgi:CheY-like chemotaxis protein
MAYALLIDDEKALLESVERTANLAGLETLTASSWEEGLKLFHVHSPDLVIADYNLPGSQHGLQLLAEIRRLRPSVRVVLLSAYIDEQDVAEIEALGVVDCALSKVSSGDPMAAILDELKQVAARVGNPTDWKAFAEAHQRADAVDQGALDELDRRLKEGRGIT